MESYYNKNSGPLDNREEMALLEMKIPLRNIMRKIGEEAESGSYPLIIGDDASGRIPTLAMKRIIDHICTEKGLPFPETRFLTGSKRLEPVQMKEKKEKLSEYFDGFGEELLRRLSAPGAKALLVTDVVDTGISIDPIIEELKKRNIGYRVVSTSLLNEYQQPRLESKWGEENLTVGDVGLPYLFGMQTLSGVMKRPEELFSTPFKNPNYSEGEKNQIQERINAAREMTDKIADGVYEQWKKERETHSAA